MTEEFLSGLINQYSAAITCFCFMGGDAEPLLVQRLAGWIKDTYPHIKTAWYSGKEALPEGFSVEVLDYLKLGPYIEALGGLKSPDTNQILYKVHNNGSLEKCRLK